MQQPLSQMNSTVDLLINTIDHFIEILEKETNYLKNRELNRLKETNGKKAELGHLYKQASSALLEKHDGKKLPLLEMLKEKSPKVLTIIQEKNKLLHHRLLENEILINKVHRGHEQFMSIILQAVKKTQKQTGRYTANGENRPSAKSYALTLDQRL